ncbi:hypothetical protein Hdeb2414_s0013g00417861 [Helianthus debilis subsp. tardiflorus]
MEAKLLQSLHMTTWTGSDNMFPKSNNSIGLCTRFENNKKRVNMLKCNLCDKPETLSRLQMFWIPEVRRLEGLYYTISIPSLQIFYSSDISDWKAQEDEQLS